MEGALRQMIGGGNQRPTAGGDQPLVDNAGRQLSFSFTLDCLTNSSECVYISSLALLKMLKHGRAGVPMEVMGLMLGEFVDDYTVQYVQAESCYICEYS